jgi:hypothetical protein
MRSAVSTWLNIEMAEEPRDVAVPMMPFSVVLKL